MMRLKERCHPFLMGRVLLKAISVFALSTLPLLALKVGLVFFVLLFNHLSLVDAAFFNDEVSSLSFDDGASVVAALLLGGILSNYIIEKGISNKGRPKGTKTRRRHHKTVAAIFDEYVPVYFRRAYRMDETSFLTLLDLIEPKMAGKPKRKRGRAPTTTTKQKQQTTNNKQRRGGTKTKKKTASTTKVRSFIGKKQQPTV
jgi:hypothetical protein